jgi:hypothetical protein
MSGYSTDHAMLGEWRRNEQLVAKPLEMTSLLSALARAMDDRLRNRKS